MCNLSIIIPVFNEEYILEESVENLIKQLRINLVKKSWEIILIENGSRDSSWDICKKLQSKFNPFVKTFQQKNSSYGAALKRGLIESRYKYIAVFNADFWDLDFLEQALHLMTVCDIVVGSKTLIAANDLRPFARRQLSYWFNVFLRTVYNFPGTDTHGLKLIKAKKIIPIVKKCYPLSELFDTQIVLHSCRKGLVYSELPVTVKEVRPSRYSQFKRTYNIIKDLLVIFRYRYL